MRAMHHERLELLQGLEHTTSSSVSSDGFSTHRINEIETQLPRLLKRHKLLRNAVLAENMAIDIIYYKHVCHRTGCTHQLFALRNCCAPYFPHRHWRTVSRGYRHYVGTLPITARSNL